MGGCQADFRDKFPAYPQAKDGELQSLAEHS